MTKKEPKATPDEKPAKRIGVMIATPLRHYRGPGDLPPQIGRALRELSRREDASGYEFEFAAACGGLCSAQNRLVHEFLNTDCKFLARWDADLVDQHGRDADALLHLLTRRQPIVGGLYCRRDKRPRWVANWLAGAKVQAAGMLQVAELGGGMKVYHRKVFEELRRLFGDEPLKDPARKSSSILYRERETGEMIAGFHQIGVVDGDLLSEDYFLDYLSRCARIPIFADTVVRMRHHDAEPVFDEGGKMIAPAKYYPEGAWPPIPAEDHP